MLRCRFPRGSGILRRYFNEYLGWQASRDMEMSAQLGRDREREEAARRYAHGHALAMWEMRAKMSESEQDLAVRATRCYDAGAKVVFQGMKKSTNLSGLRKPKRTKRSLCVGRTKTGKLRRFKCGR